MFTRKASVLIIAIALALVAGGSVSALEKVKPNAAIYEFFAARGVEAGTVDSPKSSLSAEEWSKIRAILRAEDDPILDTDAHDVLNSLVWGALNAAGASENTPMYIQIGDTQWILGDTDPADDAEE